VKKVDEKNLIEDYHELEFRDIQVLFYIPQE